MALGQLRESEELSFPEVGELGGWTSCWGRGRGFPLGWSTPDRNPFGHSRGAAEIGKTQFQKGERALVFQELGPASCLVRGDRLEGRKGTDQMWVPEKVSM